jgi:O-antigen ligase
MPMRAFLILLVATLAWGALSFGAVYPWAYWPLGAAAAALGLWGLFLTRAWRDPRVRALSLGLALVAAAIGAQIVPLEDSWVATWSPARDRLLDNATIGYRPEPWHAISIDQASTIVALALFVAFALMLVGLVRAIRLIPLRTLTASLAVLGLAFALLGIVQAAAIDRKDPLVYGFWRPGYGATPFGPFVNKNHFAGWMLMVLPVALADVLARVAARSRAGRFEWPTLLRVMAGARSGQLVLGIVAVGIMGLTIVLTASRSGMAGVALSFAVLGGAIWLRPETRAARRALTAGLVALAGTAVVWGGAAATIARFGQAADGLSGRWHAWHDTVRIVRDFLPLGTGLGTYGQAMLIYQTGDRTGLYQQAHNDYLQLFAEGGLLVAIPAAVALGLLVVQIWRRLQAPDDDVTSRWLRMGAVAGLAGIAAQSVVEFSLQMPGNTAMLVVLLAIALHNPPRGTPDAHRV